MHTSTQSYCYYTTIVLSSALLSSFITKYFFSYTGNFKYISVDEKRSLSGGWFSRKKNKKDKKKKKDKKGAGSNGCGLSRRDIGAPTGFMHLTHVGSDNINIDDIPKDWKAILAACNMSEDQIQVSWWLL